eukprot:sb/3467838/
MRGKILSILNKITPQNFEELRLKVLKLNINTQDMVDFVGDILFNKAISEPLFSETYANLCKVLCSIKLKDDPNPKVSPFRKALLNRCQKEFCREKDVEEKMDEQIHDLEHNKDLEEDESSRQMEELMYQRTKMKNKMLGNIHFIGELFNANLISPKIIICQCINTLLEIKRDEDTGLMESIDDEKIECLSKLFTTVGQKLEEECKTEDKKRLFEQLFRTYSKLQSGCHGSPQQWVDSQETESEALEDRGYPQTTRGGIAAEEDRGDPCTAEMSHIVDLPSNG